MNKVLLFGGTGNLGRHIAFALRQKNFITTAVIRNKNKPELLASNVEKVIVTDVSDPEKLKGICKGYDIVISSLGKSVSPFDNSKPGFRETDFEINTSIIEEAVKSNVKKFIYVSAFHSRNYPHLEYFKVHEEVEKKLLTSGLNYSIIKPPAIYSAFKDVFNLALKGRLITPGTGDKKTNPIFEGDLAAIIVESISENHTIVEAGGPEILTRYQINEIIQQEIAPHKKIHHFPLPVAYLFLPLVRLFSRNLYDKMSFFLAVMKEDTVAPVRGKMPLSEYVKINK